MLMFTSVADKLLIVFKFKHMKNPNYLIRYWPLLQNNSIIKENN